jgi:hypothetical protein
MGGVFETIARIEQLGGQPVRADRVAELRAQFESCTGAFVPEDPWFEERSRAFWCYAVTAARFGRVVEPELSDEERVWLGPLERAHRGLFRAAEGAAEGAAGAAANATTAGATESAHGTAGAVLIDAWGGAEFAITLVDEAAAAELAAAGGQLFDARVVVSADARTVALLSGAVFHPREATAPIQAVLAAARERALSTNETLDALLRMARTLRSLSRVKPAYAYRAEALSPAAAAQPRDPQDPSRMRRVAKEPT